MQARAKYRPTLQQICEFKFHKSMYIMLQKWQYWLHIFNITRQQLVDTHCAFYHWRPHLSSDCCIGLEQFVRVSSVIAVVASFPQQTENRTFCPVLQPCL